MNFSEDLLLAIRDGANEEVKLILEQSDLHLLFDTAGYTLLHWSVTFDNVEITQYLLDKGCQVDIQTRNKSGCTPLMLIMKADDGRDDAVMQTLLKAGADIEFVNNFNDTALEIAFHFRPSFEVLQAIFRELRKKYVNDEQLAERLIDADCPLPYAVFARNARIIEYMLEQGIPVDSPDLRDASSALHSAVGLAETEIVEVLLKYGADIEALDMHGATPLYYLCELKEGHENDQLTILKALLKKQVSLTSRNAELNGLSQSFSALIRGSCEIIEAILQSIDDFSAKDGLDNTVLHYIAENKKPGIVEKLELFLEKLDVNVPGNRGLTPLFEAIKKGNVEMVTFLLDHGADVNDYLYDIYYYSEASLKSQHDECADILLQHNADPQDCIFVLNGRTTTIFDVAIEHQNFDRINSAIAQLAINEKHGVTLTELIRSKIESYQPFEEYLNKCRGVLDINIFGTVTVFKLLTVDKRQWANYLKNEDLVIALKDIMHQPELQSHHQYYYNILKKSYSAASGYKTLRDEAAEIVCKLVDDALAENIIIVEKIIDYLDEQDLRQLHNIYKDVL